MNPYEVLGVEQNASEVEIRHQYKKRAQETHPDRSGGNEAEFVMVQQAFATILSMRKDRDGDVRRRLANLFGTFIEADSGMVIDIIKTLKASIEATQKDLMNKQGQISKRLYRIRAMKGRVTCEGENIFEDLLEQHETMLEGDLLILAEQKITNDQVLEELDSYTDINQRAIGNWQTEPC